jgi:hypothetical protein
MAGVIFSFLLFLLSFLLSYALLRKIKIFPASVNIIIAVVISFYFLFGSIYYSENLMQLIAYSTLALLMAFVIVLIYLGMKTKKKE